MILTDYYRFEKIARKSKMRMDCTASTGTYPEFECRRAAKSLKETERRDAICAGDLLIYYGDIPGHFGGDVHRKADKHISIGGKNLSSVFVPDVEANCAYGDFKGTSDALLFVFHNLEVVNGAVMPGAVIEVFVARGKSRDRIALYNLLCDGELDEDIQVLRTKAENQPNE